MDLILLLFQRQMLLPDIIDSIFLNYFTEHCTPEFIQFFIHFFREVLLTRLLLPCSLLLNTFTYLISLKEVNQKMNESASQQLYSLLLELQAKDQSIQEEQHYNMIVSPLVKSWFTYITFHTIVPDITAKNYLSQMNNMNVFVSSSSIHSFFKIFIDEAVQRDMIAMSHSANQLPYMNIDSVICLVQILNKHLDSALLFTVNSTVLQSMQECLCRSHDLFFSSFNPQSYFRLFLSYFEDVIVKINDNSKYTEYLLMYLNILSLITPSRLPGFVKYYFLLLSHPILIRDCNHLPDATVQIQYKNLLCDYLQYLSKLLPNGSYFTPYKDLYVELLKYLMMLLSHYSSFLSYHYQSLISNINFNMIEARNIILSAIPSEMEKRELDETNIEEFSKTFNSIPYIEEYYNDYIIKNHLNEPILSYIENREKSFLNFILPYMKKEEKDQVIYDLSAIQSITFYLAVNGYYYMQKHKSENGKTQKKYSFPSEIFNMILKSFTSEGQYYLLNSCIDHLRFANLHTKCFYNLTMFLYDKSTVEGVKETIFKILFERITCKSPHSWSLVKVFTDITQNEKYGFKKSEIYLKYPQLESIINDLLK